MDPVADLLLAVLASRAGDALGAQGHLNTAQRHSRSVSRRQRQLIEIASLIVTGAHERAGGLALVHGAEFPGDTDLLARLTCDVVGGEGRI